MYRNSHYGNERYDKIPYWIFQIFRLKITLTKISEMTVKAVTIITANDKKKYYPSELPKKRIPIGILSITQHELAKELHLIYCWLLANLRNFATQR